MKVVLFFSLISALFSVENQEDNLKNRSFISKSTPVDNKTGWKDLPYNLTSLVFDFLKPYNLLALRSVNKEILNNTNIYLNRIIKQSPLSKKCFLFPRNTIYWSKEPFHKMSFFKKNVCQLSKVDLSKEDIEIFNKMNEEDIPSFSSLSFRNNSFKYLKSPLQEKLLKKLVSIDICHTLYIYPFIEILEKGYLSNLRILRLNNNTVDSSGWMRALCEVIQTGQLSTLTTLDLSRNNLNSKDMQIFSESISKGQLSSLTVLNLGFNSIGSGGIREFAKVIEDGHLTHLSQIRLHYNRIYALAMRDLIISLEKNFPKDLILLEINQMSECNFSYIVYPFKKKHTNLCIFF